MNRPQILPQPLTPTPSMPPELRREQRQQQSQGEAPRRGDPSTHQRRDSNQPHKRRCKRTNSPGCSRRSKILSAVPPSLAANRRNKIHPAALPSPTTSGRKPGRAGESTAAIRTRTGTTAPLLRQTLDLDTTTSSIYTSAQQFCGPPPSPTPDRPSERRGGRRNRCRKLFPPWCRPFLPSLQ